MKRRSKAAHVEKPRNNRGEKAWGSFTRRQMDNDPRISEPGDEALDFDEASERRHHGRSLQRLYSVLFPLGTIAIAVGIWQLVVVVFDIDQFILPSPAKVVSELVNNFSVYAPNILPTAEGVLLAFAVSTVLGFSLGALIAYSKTAERSLYPILVVSQAVPKIAVAPLFVVWLGFGLLPKVLLATLVAFFPVVISTVTGLQSAPREFAYLGLSMGANRWQLFRRILFPNAIPSIFTGLKLAITFAVIGQVIGEFVGSNNGLGYLILVASSQVNTAELFGSLVLLSLMGIIAFYAVVVAEKVFFPHSGNTSWQGGL